MRTLFWWALAGAVALGWPAVPAQATTKGLNQIVTPDLQPYGQLSLSLQRQDPNIGNRTEVQVEIGLTKRFEVAFFQGANPGVQIANAEYGLYAHGPWLLSTGFLNWSTRGDQPAPYLEGGYYARNTELMLGVARAVVATGNLEGANRTSHQAQGILGYGYRVSPRLLLQLDYQSGNANSATAGFTYSITPPLQLNPAVYLQNASPHHLLGYAVLTWNIQAF